MKKKKKKNQRAFAGKLLSFLLLSLPVSLSLSCQRIEVQKVAPEIPTQAQTKKKSSICCVVFCCRLSVCSIEKGVACFSVAQGSGN